jgi:hypothetical protein
MIAARQLDDLRHPIEHNQVRHRHFLEVRNIRNSVSHDYSAGLGGLRLDEIEREALVDAAEERPPLPGTIG